ncbi:MAG TPA: DoxX family protein [Acidimicrobiia bacterium]|nr:DoxX family protein [Acidimicrobiia bacterium]
MTLYELRQTRPEKPVALIRLTLGSLFVISGLMKFLVPTLAKAWSAQLFAADLPLYTLTRWTVPFVEIGVGIVLLVGLLARPAGVVVMAIMAVATYVHVIVDDPALFPLQPSEPVIPLMVIVLSAYVIWRGAGVWSLDLKATRAAA